jgi:2-polyprenyl-3-methyl-5-hydroxy-6-metoxy-1,4-benzoquinol methylase
MPKRKKRHDQYIDENHPVVIVIEKCPACGSENIEDYLDTNLTTFFFPVPEKLIEKVKKEPFRLKNCTECSHIFQTEIKTLLLTLIYNEFYAHYNLDTSIEFQEVYRDRTVKFMQEILSHEKNQNVLDIGCGEGTYFPFFENTGYECYGIEPSEKGKIAKEKNPKAHISDTFFENIETNIFGTTFNVILMNWVLEHIAELEPFFEKLKEYINLGTKLIIQVPDIQYYIDNDIALFYAHEHINYFTIETLRILLERKGFKIVGEKYGDCPAALICGEYTGIENKNTVFLPDLLKIKKDFLVKNEELRRKVKKILSENEKMIFYGIGLVSFWISEFCLNKNDLEKIELIDDNTYYRGKVVPSFNKKIRVFPRGYNMDNTLILISTSPVYHDKIAKIIKDNFMGNYKVATISNNDIVTR